VNRGERKAELVNANRGERNWENSGSKKRAEGHETTRQR
jgi:hypothetical protein